MPSPPLRTVPEAFALALQLHQAGRLAEAETLYRQILAVEPNHANALHFLGVVAHQVGQQETAIDLIRRAIALDPANAVAHSNLGYAYHAQGRTEEAIAEFRRALELNPGDALVYYNLGNALGECSRRDEAIAAYEQALRYRPNYPAACFNLANTLRNHGRLDRAIAAYRQAWRLVPGDADVAINLGNALVEQREFSEATAVLRHALQLRPDSAIAHYNLGNALRAQGLLDEAMLAFRRALEMDPHLSEAWHNLGNAFRDRGQFDEAIASYQQALASKCDYAAAIVSLGNACKDQGRLDEAMNAFRRALQLQPEDAGTHSNLVYSLEFHPASETGIITREQERWNERFAASWKQKVPAHANDRSGTRRLRIGYVSSDFKDHVIGRNVLPLLQCHDRAGFEVVCYSGVETADELTAEFRRQADEWHATADVPDEALANAIRRDRIDILVDLTQHLAGNRLPAFAREPAPVQVSFAGYPQTSGVAAIPYRISDRWLEKGGLENSEGMVKATAREQVFLIDSFWCYDPCGAGVQTNALPAENAGMITFGCLNNFCKVNDPLLKLWARGLKAVKNSRLILLSHEGSQTQRTRQFLEGEGVDPAHIEFVAPRSRKPYLELYHRLDIALDPFPYNGHSTSLDALWMGVPVVSLCGDRPVSRAGLSQLSNLGLPELVASTKDRYVDIATGLANDIPRLKELRATLRQRMEKSVLMDASHFTRQIENCYRTMWRQWCADWKA
ncbi:TPR repeat-containing protein [Chthoniobacter flavus Ellin428]|uniref:protein O-GlcNAc transferase n=1 Tax=Chthoniobacter flavus Ellin428 TaxID=497964 RepID=B4DAV0_9BACT|nr:tetratricopeptide repeat protein [Chthoniobacter flavus]EDY16422.1 TPR repeat-containing protein [Chthoniobacter flavus Ellin428]TCO84565.1 putative O-linked N-acetylglucosamine transferase (SPINDLY family) [Chthoniobacter flavus]